MAIDTETENVISLREACDRLPKRRGGKRPHISCLYRWTMLHVGCRGVVLESVQIGGTRCTSVEALQRFFAALGEGTSAAGTASGQPSKTSARRLREAERELDRAGI